MKTTFVRFGIPWLATMGVSALLLMTSCREQEGEVSMPSDAVAMVGQHAIRREIFQATLAHRARPVIADSDAFQLKQELLEELIRFEVLYQQALAAGYDQDPEILSDLKMMIATKFLEDQRSTLGPPEVSAEEIAEYYRLNPERFGTPARARVAIIETNVPRTATPEKRVEQRQKATSILAEAQSTPPPDGTFGLLAQRHSEDQASRYQGGDIGWLTEGSSDSPWDPEVLAAISRLTEPGELAPVVETPAAFYLIRLVDRRPANIRPLAEVQDGIQYLVARQKESEQLDGLYQSLQQGLQIRTNRALLDSIHLPTMPRDLSADVRTP